MIFVDVVVYVLSPRINIGNNRSRLRSFEMNYCPKWLVNKNRGQVRGLLSVVLAAQKQADM